MSGMCESGSKRALDKLKGYLPEDYQPGDALFLSFPQSAWDPLINPFTDWVKMRQQLPSSVPGHADHWDPSQPAPASLQEGPWFGPHALHLAPQPQGHALPAQPTPWHQPVVHTKIKGYSGTVQRHPDLETKPAAAAASNGAFIAHPDLQNADPAGPLKAKQPAHIGAVQQQAANPKGMQIVNGHPVFQAAGASRAHTKAARKAASRRAQEQTNAQFRAQAEAYHYTQQLLHHQHQKQLAAAAAYAAAYGMSSQQQASGAAGYSYDYQLPPSHASGYGYSDVQQASDAAVQAWNGAQQASYTAAQGHSYAASGQVNQAQSNYLQQQQQQQACAFHHMGAAQQAGQPAGPLGDVTNHMAMH